MRLSAWNHEDVARLKHDASGIFEVDGEGPLPAYEELIFLVMMPGHRPFDPNHTQHRIVSCDDVSCLPRFGQRMPEALDRQATIGS